MSEQPPRKLDSRDYVFDWSVGVRIKVSLDGEEQSYCVAYDCDAETVTRYATNAHGKLIYDPVSKSAALETVTGVVAVQWNNE